MRLLSGQVKKLIVVFTVMILGCVGVQGAAVAKVINDRSESYPVSANSVIYDNAYNQLVYPQIREYLL